MSSVLRHLSTYKEPIIRHYVLPDCLYPWQKPLVESMINILELKKVCLNCSDMGTGKTMQTIATCKAMKKRPFIICPLSVISHWQETCNKLGVIPLAIVNYETIKTCRIYEGDTRVTTGYIKRSQGEYKWSLPPDAICVIDEVHKCKNVDSDNGRLLLSMKQLRYVVLLSGTLVEKVSEIKVFLYICGEIESLSLFSQYRKMHNLASCRKKLAEHIVRITINDLGEEFPQHTIICKKFTGSKKLVNKRYDELTKLLNAKKTPNILVKIQKKEQQIELLKVPIFVEQAELSMQCGRSVVIYVNYHATIQAICDAMNISCVIHGDICIKEREEHMKAFNSGEAKIMVCQMETVIGISLHDTTGKYPRSTFFSIPKTASIWQQALKRTFRVGIKSNLFQTIIMMEGVEHEETMINNLDARLVGLSQINGDDYLLR